MAVLSMSQPWKHPATGMFYFRQRVPRDLVKAAGKDIVKWTLGTKDPEEVRRIWPGTLAKWAAMQAEWRRKARAVPVNREEARRIAAGWLRWARRDQAFDMGGETSDLFRPFDPADAANEERRERLTRRIELHMEEAQRMAGVAVDEGSRDLLFAAMVEATATAYLHRDLRSALDGAMGPLIALHQSLPPLEDSRAPKLVKAPEGITFDALYAAWKLVAQVNPRTVDEAKGTLQKLKTFLGHDDAPRLTKADLVRWRDQMKGEGLSNITWNNRLSHVSSPLARAISDGKLPGPNPCIGLRLDKGESARKLPYDDADARTILEAARVETSPALRWAHWIMAFTGMRIGEALQLTRQDIQQDPASGVWYFRIAPDAEAGKRVKNKQPRHVPIHPALVAEGFLAFALSIEGDAPLFADKKEDKYGARGGRGWNLTGLWVREKVGITEEAKSPNHAWRHRLEDELRAAGVEESYRDAIVGHARATTGRVYGVRGEALKTLARLLSRVKPPRGLVIRRGR